MVSSGDVNAVKEATHDLRYWGGRHRFGANSGGTRKNSGFAVKILTPTELANYQQLDGRRAVEYLSGRFSAKESYSKAFGTGLGKVALQDVEILNNELGKPILTKHPFSGQAFVSISHSETLVFTEVILEKEGPERDDR
ncbi:Holo-[acyl-carrier protein] synthase [Lacticaseibacillus paracasei subsp. paracasei Lpp223]|nr:Holo-[acyl-carrier protein] synthase [Lacticaseibacillus paracasei subsp. paracasei Lpp223]